MLASEDAPPQIHDACDLGSIKQMLYKHKNGKSENHGDKLALSFQHLKTLLFNHSCDWPPHTLQVFSSKDVDAIIKYMLDTYYRHFKLFHFNYPSQTMTMEASRCSPAALL